MSQKKTKSIFLYTNEVLNCDILVCVDSYLKDIEKFADKKVTPIFKELVKSGELKDFDKHTEQKSGFLYQIPFKGFNFYFLYLREFKNSWTSFESLLHEIVHLKQFQFENKSIINENEFEAYLIESIFRELRQKLFKNLNL